MTKTTEKMEVIEVAVPGRAYPIYIGRHLLGASDPLIRHVHGRQVAIISDSNVAPLFEPPLQNTLGGYHVLSVVIPAGEQYKNLNSAETIYKQLLERKFNRDTTIIAVGGGMIGDLCGFVASTYQRGVPFIQVPTTLLAQVDASVGGKTAVNHSLGKNMIGTFYQPQCVIVDIAALASLPAREYRSGIAEIIKYGLIADKNFFEYLEENAEQLCERDTETLRYAIRSSCLNKANIVVADETDRGKRMLLNFGHTFAHAIETAQNYTQLLHGEAVAIGMRLATQLSCELGYVDKTVLERVINILDTVGLPTDIPDGVAPNELMVLMARDKKVADNTLQLVLLEELGRATLTPGPDRKKLGDFLARSASIKG